MEFFIRKNSTLPILEIDLIKDGRLDFNYINSNLNGSTIYFSMKDIDTQVYRVLNGVCTLDISTNAVYYTFTKKNTVNTGRFICEFSFNNDQGIANLPINDNLYVTILDSFSDSKFCCVWTIITPIIPTPTPTPTPTLGPTPTPTATPIPTPTPTPTATPEPSKIYYGKFTGDTITSGNVINLTVLYTNSVIDTYVNFTYGSGDGTLRIKITYKITTFGS